MANLVYRTENKLDNKFYYGVHNGSNPDYLGSGKLLKRAIKKYGKDNFVRRTIMEFDTLEEAYAFEAIMVDKQLIEDPKCYNVATGGHGGWDHIDTPSYGNLGKTHSKETKAKMSVARRKRIITDETRAKLSKVNSGTNHPRYNIYSVNNQNKFLGTHYRTTKKLLT